MTQNKEMKTKSMTKTMESSIIEIIEYIKKEK